PSPTHLTTLPYTTLFRSFNVSKLKIPRLKSVVKSKSQKPLSRHQCLKPEKNLRQSLLRPHLKPIQIQKTNLRMMRLLTRLPQRCQHLTDYRIIHQKTQQMLGFLLEPFKQILLPVHAISESNSLPLVG